MKVLKSLKLWCMVGIIILGILAIVLFMLPNGETNSVSIDAVESQSSDNVVESDSDSDVVYDDALASGLSSMVEAMLNASSSAVNEVVSNVDDSPATNEIVVEEVVVEDTIVEEVVESESVVESNNNPVVEDVVSVPVSNIVFYGDSWMDNPVFRGKFGASNILRVKGAKWAQYFVQTGLVTPESNVKGVFVQFGLNDWQTGETGLTESSYMKQFLDQVAVAHPNVPIMVTRSPHTGSGYVSMTGCNINPRCDRYSQYVKEYCDSHDNFYYVDVTSCLEDSNGWLKSDLVDSSTYHLSTKGYSVWLSSIESTIFNVLNN